MFHVPLNGIRHIRQYKGSIDCFIMRERAILLWPFEFTEKENHFSRSKFRFSYALDIHRRFHHNGNNSVRCIHFIYK